MRIAFAGTPEFASTALAALHGSAHQVVLVLTQPDRCAGRGMKLHASPVKQLALAHGLALVQPRSLRLDGRYPEDAAKAQAVLLAAAPDVMVVAAYGLILPQWALDVPRYGCLNIHASLLPRWRGAAPIHRAIEAGDTSTGITLMQMDAGLDTGAMLAVQHLDITPTDTTASLHDRLADLGASMVIAALAQLGREGLLPATTQPECGVTYAHKIDKSEATLDWRQSAETLARRVRAFNPFPGTSTSLNGEAIKVWAAQVLGSDGRHSAAPGTVLQADASGIAVCAQGSVLLLTQLQRPGGKRLSAAEFLRGCPVAVSTRLGDA